MIEILLCTKVSGQIISNDGPLMEQQHEMGSCPFKLIENI